MKTEGAAIAAFVLSSLLLVGCGDTPQAASEPGQEYAQAAGSASLTCVDAHSRRKPRRRRPNP